RRRDRPLEPARTPKTQHAWLARQLPLILAKPYVQGVLWSQLHDSIPHDFPHAGLFDFHRRPKPALPLLTSLSEALSRQ
ncbi:MAG TPA: hypothetical protein VJL29_11835, partial [Thermoguttaceae bacterium]|nr:hypothetical protein [Thermoguttaceae bacterium]